MSDVVVVSSVRYRVESPPFRSLVSRLVGRAPHHRQGDQRAQLPRRQPIARLTRRACNPGSALREKRRSDQTGAAARDSRQAARPASPSRSPATTRSETTSTRSRRATSSTASSGFGLPAALVILLLVFGAVVAGLVPVLMAIVSIIVGLGLVALLSLEFSLSIFIVNMLSGMGLALGIDYSLFVISRYREERRAALDKDGCDRASPARRRAGPCSSAAAPSSSRCSGMLLVPTSIMRSLAAGAIIVGVVSVVAALTLLPGAARPARRPRRTRCAMPVLGRNLGRTDAAEGRFWRAIIERVLRRPALEPRRSRRADARARRPRCSASTSAPAASPRCRTICPRSKATSRSSAPSRRRTPTRSRSSSREGTSSVATDLATLRARSPPTRASGRARSRPSPASARLAAHGARPRRRRSAAPRRRGRARPAHAGAARRLRRHRAPASSSEDRRPRTPTTSTPPPSPTPYVLAVRARAQLHPAHVAFRSLVVALVSILFNLLSVGAAYGLLTLVFLDGRGAGLLRLRARPCNRRLGPALPLLRPLRPLDGLPGLPDEPHQGALRPESAPPAKQSPPASPRPHESSPAPP